MALPSQGRMGPHLGACLAVCRTEVVAGHLRRTQRAATLRAAGVIRTSRRRRKLLGECVKRERDASGLRKLLPSHVYQLQQFRRTRRLGYQSGHGVADMVPNHASRDRERWLPPLRRPTKRHRRPGKEVTPVCDSYRRPEYRCRTNGRDSGDGEERPLRLQRPGRRQRHRRGPAASPRPIKVEPPPCPPPRDRRRGPHADCAPPP